MKRCADPLTKEEAEEKIEKEEQKAVAEETQEHKEEAAPCENKFVVFHFFSFIVSLWSSLGITICVWTCK